jgi:deoxycytidylate deaminase
MSSSRKQGFIDHAIKMAQKSTMEHKHGAVIVLHNEIIATGFNHRVDFMCHKYSIHAEVDALLKVKGRTKAFLDEAEMYVVRIGSFQHTCPDFFSVRYSKPCADCQKAIVKYGIRKVYYSINDDTLKTS